jgi:hypothetical protein
MHKNSLRLMAGLLDKYAPTSGLCVDVGSYDVNGTYRPLVEGRGLRYLGIDIAPGPNVDVVIEPYGIQNTPWGMWKNDPPALVISGQCLEHTTRPWDWMKDVRHIVNNCTPLIVIAPAMWPHHRYPVDCWRIYPDGMRSLLEFAGLEVLEAGLSKIDASHEDCWGVGRA